MADLSSAVRRLEVGTQDEPDVELAPLISDRQRNRVASFVERAQMTGHIEITAGGKARAGGGFFYEPTVVAGARPEDEIVKRKVFGPVVSVVNEMPHGGMKSSGYGKDMSMYALEDYMVARHVMVKM